MNGPRKAGPGREMSASSDSKPGERARFLDAAAVGPDALLPTREISELPEASEPGAILMALSPVNGSLCELA